MQRITISLDDELFSRLDALIIQKGVSNRSEIFRDLIREELRKKKLALNTGFCTAVISYSYKSSEEIFPEKLISQQEGHNVSLISILHVHASNEECVGAIILRGQLAHVRQVGEAVIATKGIVNGFVHLIPDQEARKLIY